jgi:hypothetical protein
VEIGTCSQELAEGMEVEIIGKDLDDHFHEVVLCNDVFTIDDLFQDGRKDCTAVHFQIYSFHLRESDEVGTDQDSEISSFKLSLLPLSGVALML